MSRISVGDLGKPTALTMGLIINCIEQVVRTTEIHAIKKIEESEMERKERTFSGSGRRLVSGS
jgi:hypothetical protein